MRFWALVAVLLFASSAVGSSGGQSIAQEEVVVTVDSTNFRFSPSTVTITEGGTVRFFWSGELLAHNAVADDGLFDSGDPSTSVDYSFTFEVGTNGTHTYVCEPHEAMGMVGTVVVEPAPPVEPAEPEPEPVGDESAESDEMWIPFLGVELVVLGVLAVVIYNYGVTRGMVETRLELPESEEESVR